MKLVTFRVGTPVGPQERLGILLDERQDGRIVDLTAAYTEYLKTKTDEPTPEGLADLRTPPDMIGWLRGGHKSRQAADDALEFVGRRLAQQTVPRTSNGSAMVYDAKSVRLLAPLPRPNSIRDFSTYFQHMMKSGRRSEKRPSWYTNPPYYKGNPNTIVGPGDDVPFPYYTEKLDLGTGTIGFGCSMDYHKWPQVGQVMKFEVEGIGTMIHKIVAGEHVVDHVLGMKGLIEKPAAKAG